MSGFVPVRSKVCAFIGAPHNGHGRAVRAGSGEVSYGPTEAGPAALMSEALIHEYHPPAARTLVRSDCFPDEPLLSAIIISVLTNVGRVTNVRRASS
ncbi:hypothetical protein FHX49_002367 [Microbacterium endophyticum]|uniref:Uncharacterized protein n=1 Tax=Microbacterium endophyticum TaxID=1526412 RepID=A0A7W4YPH5_9MICO|nr:hypothetical protein [Microbacterium endophyticum]NIK36582.1 hypothetical protein [Microbacterium endophyticum]